MNPPDEGLTTPGALADPKSTVSTISDAAAPPGFGPVAGQERIEVLDILRGFALLCILIVNWTVNTHWDTDLWGGFSGTADQVAYWTLKFLLDEKSWPMFTFLFGLGFAIQVQRARARAAPFVATYIRRLVVLFLIGGAHFILTERDILYEYALLGLLLLPLRQLRPNLLLALALTWLLVGFTLDARMAYDRLARLASETDAKVESALSPTALVAYVGEYKLTSEPHTIFVTSKGGSLFAQSPGYRGDRDVPIRLFASSPVEFYSRSTSQRISFERAASGAVTGLVLSEDGDNVSGRKVRGAPFRMDDQVLRRASTQGPVDRVYATGSFLQIVELRAALFAEAMRSWAMSYEKWLQSNLFPPFLLGVYAGRRRLFHEVAKHRQFFRHIMWGGLALGLVANALPIMLDLLTQNHPLGRRSIPFAVAALVGLLFDVGSPALGMAYLAALTLLLQGCLWRNFLAPLGAVGRMALTNYLLQSVAFVLLFFGYGLGWYGQVGASAGLILALAFFALQIALSRWWLTRFRFGPAEWVWRSATYGAWQQLRLKMPAHNLVT